MQCNIGGWVHLQTLHLSEVSISSPTFSFSFPNSHLASLLTSDRPSFNILSSSLGHLQLLGQHWFSKYSGAQPENMFLRLHFSDIEVQWCQNYLYEDRPCFWTFHTRLFDNLDSLRLACFDSLWCRSRCNNFFLDTFFDLRDRFCLRVHMLLVWQVFLCLEKFIFEVRMGYVDHFNER